MSGVPRQTNPQSPEATAMAPYNFVPLPNAVLEVENGIEVNGQKQKLWLQHDQFTPGTHSGWVDVELETLTPLFIRGAVRQANGWWDACDARTRPDPYCNEDGTPAIPGSSWRGMIRALVEILSFSKIKPVTGQRPFFRDLANSRIGYVYRAQFVRDLGTLTTGFHVVTGAPVTKKAAGYESTACAGTIHVHGSKRVIRQCDYARVDHAVILGCFGGTAIHTGRPKVPRSDLQGAVVDVTCDSAPRDYHFPQPKPAKPGQKARHPDLYLRFRKVTALKKGSHGSRDRLIVTGPMRNKHLEFVFLTSSTLREVSIPDEVWDRFHDDDQITQWQEKAYPSRGRHGAPGVLQTDDPVFFLCDPASKSPTNPDGLVFLGRAQLFRLPYDRSPAGLVPGHLSQAALDLAEAMFGRVEGEDAIKGRVFFEDAAAIQGGPPWLHDVLVPSILSAPKVTTFQHYLTQDGSGRADQLNTYINGDATTIRGHKLYWHRWGTDHGLDQVRHPDARSIVNKLEEYKQHTRIRPVRERVVFRGRVRFDNLSQLELGALLAALQLRPDAEHEPAELAYAHRLGMGKPLGLGSVRVKKLHLTTIDRLDRYSGWAADGARPTSPEPFVRVFVDTMLEHARRTGEVLLADQSGLRRIARLDVLFRILSWDLRPDSRKTRYMVIEKGDASRFKVNKAGNEYYHRPVLPTPHHVVDQPDPWEQSGYAARESPGRDTPRVNAAPATPDVRITGAREAGSRKARPIREGDRVNGEIASIEGGTALLSLSDGTRISIRTPPEVSLFPGMRIKVAIEKVSREGAIVRARFVSKVN